VLKAKSDTTKKVERIMKITITGFAALFAATSLFAGAPGTIHPDGGTLPPPGGTIQPPGGIFIKPPTGTFAKSPD
jgi:hypothetical protein